MSNRAGEDADSVEARRAARADWPVRKYRLGEEPGDDLSATTTPAERIAMMWELAVQAWRLAGREVPTYDRSETPVKRFLPGEERPE